MNPRPSLASPGNRKAQRGQTVLLVAVSTVALISMAALAIDVSTLYIARSEAEKAAAAGALAGARAFVSSGFTSGGLGVPSSGSVQSTVCNGSSGLADVQATAAVNRNLISGKAPASVTTTCAFPNPENPRITVTVSETNLPTFFSRIWGASNNQVSATAKAEAYNPSGHAAPVRVASVKPWLLANCNFHAPPYSALNPNCPIAAGMSADYFVDPANNYQVVNGTNVIGNALTLQQVDPTLAPVPGLNLGSTFYALDLPIDAASASCPAASSPSCDEVNPAAPGYAETIACANANTLKCGDTVTLKLLGGLLTFLTPGAIKAPMCLIHSSANGLNRGQDIFHPPLSAGDPITIEGGDRNPDANLQGKVNISRSDSVVTVPLWNGNIAFSPPGGTATVIGFMQLGITQTQGVPGLTSEIDATILNVSGCGTAGGTTVAGGKTSPIPVRLIQ